MSEAESVDTWAYVCEVCLYRLPAPDSDIQPCSSPSGEHTLVPFLTAQTPAV